MHYVQYGFQDMYMDDGLICKDKLFLYSRR